MTRVGAGLGLPGGERLFLGGGQDLPAQDGGRKDDDGVEDRHAAATLHGTPES